MNTKHQICGDLLKLDQLHCYEQNVTCIELVDLNSIADNLLCVETFIFQNFRTV